MYEQKPNVKHDPEVLQQVREYCAKENIGIGQFYDWRASIFFSQTKGYQERLIKKFKLKQK